MNFLVHTYLSFGNDKAIVGNLIADMVKGKQIESFPEEIQKGIILHREIDAFTDKHAAIKETKGIFRKTAGRYDAAFLDVAYDHFLAIDTSRTPADDWQPFADKCYAAIEAKAEILPHDFCTMFAYMRSENWLANYQHRWLIERSFERLKRRAKFLSNEADVFGDFEKNYTLLTDSYLQFFPDLEDYALKTYKNLFL